MDRRYGAAFGLVADPMGGAREADEGFLHQVLGGIAVVDEQARQTHQRLAFLLEQPDDERIDVERRSRSAAWRRPTSSGTASVRTGREEPSDCHRPDRRRPLAG